MMESLCREKDGSQPLLGPGRAVPDQPEDHTFHVFSLSLTNYIGIVTPDPQQATPIARPRLCGKWEGRTSRDGR